MDKSVIMPDKSVIMPDKSVIMPDKSVKMPEIGYCPLSEKPCRIDCEFLDREKEVCAVFSLMMTMNKINNLMELMRIERS